MRKRVEVCDVPPKGPSWRARLAALALLMSVTGSTVLGRARSETKLSVPVILISVDTLRADHLSAYGYRRFATPHIDALGQGGTVFTEIESQVPLTLPSHTSLMTSTYPFANHVEENGQVVAPGTMTLAEALRSHGYHTAAFIGGYFLARRFGLDQGFETYDSPFSSTRGSLTRALDLKRPAADVLRPAQAWLERHADRPFFLFVHLFDLHRPYDPPPAFRARFGKDEYDAELAYVDSVLGEFWKFLAAQHLYDRSLIVFTADHGESLGEHGESTHGYFVYQSTLHVPLIVHWPQGAPAFPSRVDAPAGLIDVAPTILQAVGLNAPATFQGNSLLGPLEGADEQRKVYSESVYARDNFRCASLRSLRVGNYHYIYSPEPELYDLSHDAAELHNLAGRQQDLAATFRSELAALRSQYGAPREELPQPINRRERARLRSLGYVALSNPEELPEESGVDAKQRLPEYRQYLRATRLAETGRFPEAVATFKEILEEDPQNFPIRYDLAECYVEERQFYASVQELKQVLAQAPHDASAGDLLGIVWLDLHEYPRARAEFENVLSIDAQDYDAEYNLGVADALDRRPDDAMHYLHLALSVRPNSAEAHNALGRVYMERGDLSEAEDEFRQALILEPHLAEAHYNLGQALIGEEHPHRAAQEFREALQEDPHYAAARQAIEKLDSYPK